MRQEVEELNTDIFGHEATNKKLNDEQKRQRDRDLADLKAVVSRPEGRRFIWKWLSKYGVFRSPFSTNTAEMSKNCGLQLAGQYLLAEVNEADQNCFAQMQREYISEAKSKENKDV